MSDELIKRLADKHCEAAPYQSYDFDQSAARVMLEAALTEFADASRAHLPAGGEAVRIGKNTVVLPIELEHQMRERITELERINANLSNELDGARELSAERFRLMCDALDKLDAHPAPSVSAQAPECQHELHWFGDQKRRRCVKCDGVEGIHIPPAPTASGEGEGK